MHRSQSLLPSDWDPVAAADDVMGKMIAVTPPEVKGAHDSDMVILDKHAYIVCMANNKRPGESARWPEVYAAMAIVNIETLHVEQWMPFAESGQAFENETLPIGACFVPRIIQKNARRLRCFFASEQPGQRQSQMWYRDFDLHSRTFDNRIYKVKVKTALGTYDMQPGHVHRDAVRQGFNREPEDFGLYFIDSFKKFDGNVYAVINNYAGGLESLSAADASLETFEIMGYFFDNDLRLSESAVNRLPDGSWHAICRTESKSDPNYRCTTSADGRTWTHPEPCDVFSPGMASKPTFDKFGQTYYLGWQEAARIDGISRSVFNVDISQDGKTWERKYRFQTKRSFQYPRFYDGNGSIWVCVTEGDADDAPNISRKKRIVFGKLEDVKSLSR